MELRKYKETKCSPLINQKNRLEAIIKPGTTEKNFIKACKEIIMASIQPDTLLPPKRFSEERELFNPREVLKEISEYSQFLPENPLNYEKAKREAFDKHNESVSKIFKEYFKGSRNFKECIKSLLEIILDPNIQETIRQNSTLKLAYQTSRSTSLCKIKLTSQLFLNENPDICEPDTRHIILSYSIGDEHTDFFYTLIDTETNKNYILSLLPIFTHSLTEESKFQETEIETMHYNIYDYLKKNSN